MIRIKRITITRLEGPVELCDKKREFSGYSALMDAQRHVNQASHTYPKRGYDKHKFSIEWEDGETYEGRLDCKAYDSSRPNPNLIAEHISSVIEYVIQRQMEGDPLYSPSIYGDMKAFIEDRQGFVALAKKLKEAK